MTPEAIRKRIAEMQNQTGNYDGDARWVGDALAFYAQGVGDTDLQKTVVSTLKGLINWATTVLEEVQQGAYVKHIAMSGDLYGHWGAGVTEEEAKQKLKKSGGKLRNCNVLRFHSDLPFAPPDRPATEQEADCWVGKDGSLNWVRCVKVG